MTHLVPTSGPAAMKISDPLGKVYTHTMFKKKSYNIPKGTRNVLNNEMISPPNVQVVTVISWTTPEISAMRMMRVKNVL